MKDRTFHRAALLLALTTWLVYAASATGSLSIDPDTRLRVVENLFRSGEVALAKPTRLTVEHEGRPYSVFLPGQSVVFAPVAGAGVAARAVGVGDGLVYTASRFVAGVFFVPAFAALAVLGHVVLLRLLGVRPRIALGGGAVLAFATALWVWGASGSEETILAALGVWTFVAMLDADRRLAAGAGGADGARAVVDRLGFAGWLLAVGLIHRTTFVTVILAAAIVGVPVLYRARTLIAARWGRFGLWVAAGLATLAIVPLYNWARFGDPLNSGYAAFYEPLGGIFQTPLYLGLMGLLFSPGESLFIFMPWLVLVPVALIPRVVRRRLGLLGWAIGIAVAVHLVIYGKHTFWSGALGWGVRFHVSLLPLVLVPVAVWIDALRPGRAGWAALGALAALSMFMQVAGKSLNMGLEHIQFPEQHSGYTKYSGNIPLDAAWTWRRSHCRLRFVNIADKLRGRELLAPDADDSLRIRSVWNIFPLRAAVFIESRRIIAALWVLWAGLLAASLAAGVATVRRW